VGRHSSSGVTGPVGFLRPRRAVARRKWADPEPQIWRRSRGGDSSHRSDGMSEGISADDLEDGAFGA
jgi:hypothetical protein